MTDNINLLVHDTSIKPSETKGLKMYRRVAIGSFVVTLLVSLVFLLLILFSPLQSLTEDKTNLITQLTQSTEKFVNFLTLEDRMKSIKGVISSRPPYDSLTELLDKQVPPGASVQTIKMLGKNITFGIKSSSLDLMDTFIENLKSTNSTDKKVFRTMSLTSLTYNKQLGAYILTVDMTLL